MRKEQKKCPMCQGEMRYLSKTELYVCERCKRLESEVGSVLYQGKTVMQKTC